VIIPSKRQRQILTMLSDGEHWREDEIKSSFHFLQQMCLVDWISGAGYADRGGIGTTKQTRVWWILPAGREALAACQ